ncbi:DUF4157 domain-containing protein [Streptomyces sp. NPDC059994]|uniref:eCIS core domain-containing protein n=1 Tax=Streptomyces sp. NPDC059994 TaxID=3347029 RepID=UPI003698730E
MGNRVVARLLKEERHTHGAGCGHDGVEDSTAKAQSALIASAIRSESSQIPDPLRGKAESFFGNDFSRGRFHDGPVAQRAIEAMGARALTIDNHVFLPPPGARDMALIGHEFSHLNKNLNGERETGTDNGAGLKVTNPNQPSERTADTEGNDFAADVATAPSVTAQRSVAADSGAEPVRAELVQRAARPQGDAMDVDHFGSDEDLDEAMTDAFDRQDAVDTAELDRLKKLGLAGRHREFLRLLRSHFSGGKWKIEKSTPEGDFEAATKERGKSKAHSYEDQPQVRRLRWISTVIKEYLTTVKLPPIEVQAAIDDSGRLIVAANDKSANEHLAELAANGGATDSLGHMLGNAARPEARAGSAMDERARVDRVNRHFDQASDMHSGAAPVPAALRTALAQGMVVAAGGAPGQHAELRILASNNGKTPPYLGGTKRPCATCLATLYPHGSPKGGEGRSWCAREGSIPGRTPTGRSRDTRTAPRCPPRTGRSRCSPGSTSPPLIRMTPMRATTRSFGGRARNRNRTDLRQATPRAEVPPVTTGGTSLPHSRRLLGRRADHHGPLRPARGRRGRPPRYTRGVPQRTSVTPAPACLRAGLQWAGHAVNAVCRGAGWDL